MTNRTVLAFLFGGLALGGQSPVTDKTLHFANTPSGLHREQIATVIRGLTEGDLKLQNGELGVRASGEQLQLAESLLAILDRTPDMPAPQPTSAAPGEFRLNNGTELVRLVYLPWVGTNQQLAEVSTIVRSTSEIKRLFVYEPLKVMAMRGSTEQLASGEWLVAQLAPGVRANEGDKREFQLASSAPDRVLRIAKASFVESPRELAEAATVVRAITGIRRVFTENQGQNLALRGTAEQMQVADWLLQRFANKPRVRMVAYTGTVPENSREPADAIADHLVLHYLNVPDRGTLEKVAGEVRKEGQIPYVFLYGPHNAVAIRGNASQLATADRLLKERGY